MKLSGMIQSGLSDTQLLLLILALASGIISIIFFALRKKGLSILALFTAGLLLRLVASGLDPFLNLWDEQFHALVAKNMMTHPFKPMLYTNPVLDYDYQSWINNHVWLHKQPWFLWQISLCLKLFGVNLFALRLPTVLMSSLMILIIYRIGERTVSARTGWLGAFFYTFSFFWVNFTAGSTFSDHNDSAFIFYIALSIWSWVEYRHSGNRKWILLIGLFSGIAILNKWLAGFLVYSGWMVSVLFHQGISGKMAELKRIGLSLLITVLVAAPWQIYILSRFPLESAYEFRMNAQHFLRAIETHEGNLFYYFLQLPVQYGGGIMAYFLIPAGLFFLFRNTGKKQIRVGLLTMTCVVYIFFTVAATKMPLFCSIVLPVVFLALGALGDTLIGYGEHFLSAKWVAVILVPVLGYFALSDLDLKQLDSWHSAKSEQWRSLRNASLIDRYAGKLSRSGKDVYFNCGAFNSIQFMFYNQNSAYGVYPTYEEYMKLKSLNINMIVFTDPVLPDYLRHDRQVRKIFLSGFQY